MVKMVIFIKRKAGMSFEEFDRYWRENHGPLVMSVTEFSRHVRRYVQGHVIREAQSAFSRAEPKHDGVAELWFDSLEDLKHAFSEPRYMEIIRPDELKLADLSGCSAVVVNEVPMIGA